MIFLRLFLTFSYIGLLNFGGGYAMLSFIQQEVVTKSGWLSEAEFTDIVAISQMTPGPIGINCATYVGYTSVAHDAWVQTLTLPYASHMMGILGAILATLSVVWLPFIVMILVSKLILRYKDSIVTRSIFAVLRPAIIGLLASAALSLINVANFGHPSAAPWHCALSVIIFFTVLIGVKRYHWGIIYTTLACGIVGAIAYGVIGIPTTTA